MKTVCHSLVLAAALALLLSSCASQAQYHGVQPVSPMPPLHFNATAAIDSVQPALSWRPVDSGATKYDLIICKGIPTQGNNQANAIPYYYIGKGDEVYYREGIGGDSHRVEEPLSRRTVYVWAVRTRTGTAVGQWSTYDFRFVNALGSGWGRDFWWSFRTP